MQSFIPEQLLTLNASINLLVSNCYNASCEAKMPNGSCVGHRLESKHGKRKKKKKSELQTLQNKKLLVIKYSDKR